MSSRFAFSFLDVDYWMPGMSISLGSGTFELGSMNRSDNQLNWSWNKTINTTTITAPQIRVFTLIPDHPFVDPCLTH